MRETGVLVWHEITQDGQLISWTEIKDLMKDKISLFKYIQLKSYHWV